MEERPTFRILLGKRDMEFVHAISSEIYRCLYPVPVEQIIIYHVMYLELEKFIKYR